MALELRLLEWAGYSDPSKAPPVSRFLTYFKDCLSPTKPGSIPSQIREVTDLMETKKAQIMSYYGQANYGVVTWSEDDMNCSAYVYRVIEGDVYVTQVAELRERDRRCHSKPGDHGPHAIPAIWVERDGAVLSVPANERGSWKEARGWLNAATAAIEGLRQEYLTAEKQRRDLEDLQSEAENLKKAVEKILESLGT